MKLECDRLSLADALAMAGGVITTRTPTPALLCVRLVAKDGMLEISATDTEIGLSLSIPNVSITEEGEALIPADKLTQIVRACEDTTIAISVVRNLATITAADSTFKIYGYEPREFPTVRGFPAKVDFELDAALLRRLISRTVFATARDDSRYAISGVLMDRKKSNLRLVATDGRRLAVARGSCKGSDADQQAIIPTKALSALNRLLNDPEAMIRVAREGSQVIFQVGEAADGGATLSTTVDERTFPPFEDVIPKDHDRRCTCDAGELSSAIRRASLLTNEESKGVRMSFSAKHVTLTSRAPEMGESEVRIGSEQYQGEPLEIAFNPNFIAEVLKVLDAPQVVIELKAPNKPGVIKSGTDYTYVVMPVSLT